jgi:TRAP-type uncharacterized transport system substrate-binding protein
MKLWLARLFSQGSNAATSAGAEGHVAGTAMSLGSIEHMVQNRIRLFLRHTWLVTFLGTVVLAGLAGLAVYYVTKDTVMKVAAGPEGGINTEFVQALSKKIAKGRDRIDVQLVGTAGPKATEQAIIDHDADLAILPSTIGKSPDWPVVAILRQNVMALVVPAPAAAKAAPDTAAKAAPDTAAKAAPDTAAKAAAEKPAKPAKKTKGAKPDKKTEKADKADQTDDDGKLAKVTQLAGRRIGIVNGNEANADLLNVVLGHYGVPLDKVQISQIDPANLAAAVHNDQVDAIFVAGPATGRSITDAVAAATRDGAAPSFIEIDQAEGIARRNPAFDSIEIDAGTFGGNPPTPADSLKTLSFPEYLVARNTFSHAAVTTLARVIFSSRLALAAAMPGEVKIQAPSIDKDAAALVHPGARAYLNDDEKSFFDRYGDQIFYGLLIFPIFGSAIAGIATYFRGTHRTRRLRLLQRLLDLVRKAHAAPSLEAIDKFERDVDNLVVAIIHQSEHEEYDQAVQMSFSLALDQVRFALAARRAALVEQGGAESKPGDKAAAA